MAIDVTEGKLIRVNADVPALDWLPSRPSSSTLARWVKPGLRDPSGQLVRLEVVRVGGKNCTTEAALMRFFERLAADAPTARTPSQSTKATKRAADTLAAAGF